MFRGNTLVQNVNSQKPMASGLYDYLLYICAAAACVPNKYRMRVIAASTYCVSYCPIQALLKISSAVIVVPCVCLSLYVRSWSFIKTTGMIELILARRFRLTYPTLCYKEIRFGNRVIFTARCYASAVLAMALCLSVRLSVCPSQVGVLLKQLNVVSQKQHHTIAQGLQFSDAKDLREIQPGSPPTRAPNAGGVSQNRRLSTNKRLYLENGTRQTHGFY